MDKMSAIQQAQKMFQKLVDARINKAAKPSPMVRSYPVSTLPGGQVLLSNGKTQISFPAQRAQQIQQSNFNQMKSPIDTKQQIGNINNEINTPARELALGGPSGDNYFVNLLSQILKPKLQGAPEIGALTALLPTLQDKLSPVQKTAATANLPQLAPDTKSMFDDAAGFYKKFLSNTNSLQNSLAEDFLANYTRRETPSNTMGRMPKYLPLSQNYQNRFGIPSANNAGYAQITTDANSFNKRI